MTKISADEQPNETLTEDVKPIVAEQKVRNENAPRNVSKSQKSRHRASVACASCRDRRIRCVVPPGENECTQCKRAGVECIIKNDDERRRPISRAYMSSLTDRVALLEHMLKERGADVPPANHPPKTRHSARNLDFFPKEQVFQVLPKHENSSPGRLSSPDSESVYAHDNGPETESPAMDAESAASPAMIPPPKKEGMVSRLLSANGHLSLDQMSGRLRYFGPTANCHVHSELGNSVGLNQASTEQARRAEKMIQSLSMETHDYLMDLFWNFYNSVIHVVHQDAFTQDWEAGRTRFYSTFLHLCLLAMGFRFADKTRLDIQKIALPHMESTLHREAKYMLDVELERPGGISSVAAFLLLGELECGVGRDNLGWLYGGLAVRLAFDIGLHLDARLSGLPEQEVEIRQMTLWACVIHDKYSALFLGRPTSMKSADLEIYSLSKQFQRLGTCRPVGPGKTLETQIYEALLDLMELAGKITEITAPMSHQFDATVNRSQYRRVAALDRAFNSWYARLPEELRWTSVNIASAPFSFFLMHQQFHTSMILLHRPFAMFEDQSLNGYESNGSDDHHFSAISRTVCTKHAIKVAQIFWQHRQRFDIKQIFFSGLQHAGTAVTALVAALAFIRDPIERNSSMQYLECLSAALQDMACTYQPAERMSAVLRVVMLELRGGPSDNMFKLYHPTSSAIPARRCSTDEPSDLPVFKRRQFSRPRAGTGPNKRRSSSISTSITTLDLNTRPLPPLFDHDSDRSDSYTMSTPHSELSSWPPLSEASLESPMPTPPSTTASTLFSLSEPPNSWLGTHPHVSNPISQLGNVHFPEIGPLGGSVGMCHLDFMSLGDLNGNADWVGTGREAWSAGTVGVGGDLDGFPPQHGFNGFRGSGFGIMN